MTYAESIEFLYGLQRFGLKLGLENTRTLAAQTGNPQERLRFIHIAGTNGKGSVAAMLESIYRASGLKVGLFTSPHLVSFRERIQINRELISEADVVQLVATLREQSRTGFQSVSHNSDRPEACPTFFEFVTVMALQYFARQDCDLVIWETGLGGRLDATNIVTPLVSVITNIEPDHQRWLGHDLKSIAAEKAGIIKPGIPSLTATTQPEALAVIQETAQAQQSPLTQVTPDHLMHPPLDQLKLPLPGWHQRMNAAVAVATVRLLQPQLKVSPDAIRSGLETVRWDGRLQLFETSDGNVILLDGAHNVSSATSLRAVLDEDFPGARPTLLLGMLQDKDWRVMCETLAPISDRILCVTLKSELGTNPNQLAEVCRLTNKTAEVKVMESAAAALKDVVSEPLVVVAGSLYLVGEALEVLDQEKSPATNEQGLNAWNDPRSG